MNATMETTTDLEALKVKVTDARAEVERLKVPAQTREENIARRERLAEAEDALRAAAAELADAEATEASFVLIRLRQAERDAEQALAELREEGVALQAALDQALAVGDVAKVGALRLTLDALPHRQRAAELAAAEVRASICECEATELRGDVRRLQCDLAGQDKALAELEAIRQVDRQKLVSLNGRIMTLTEQARAHREKASALRADLTTPGRRPAGALR
jgi:hypothetical protein